MINVSGFTASLDNTAGIWWYKTNDKMAKKLINIRIDEDLKKKASIKAIEVGTTLTKVVTDILQNFIK